MGATSPGRAGSSAPAANPIPSPAGPTRLRITILPGFVANATTRRYALRCNPPSGTVHDPGTACRELLANRALLSVTSRCFLPDTGSNVVSGESEGRPIHVRLGNCDPDAAAWARLAAALGVQPPSSRG